MRSRGNQWEEDGLAGICDDNLRRCFVLALRNGKALIFEERWFGLVASESFIFSAFAVVEVREVAKIFEDSMNTAMTESRQPRTPPRFIAISGIVFSSLFIISLILIRLAIPARPTEPGDWLNEPVFRNWVHISLNLVPFAGIAFLWFMGVLRNRIGLQEDRFFATVFLGSGLLFVAMLFVAVSVTRGLMDTFSAGPPEQSETYRVGRGIAYALVNTFGMRMAGVFVIVTSTIGIRTTALSRWVSLFGFVCGLVLLMFITTFAWIALVFPLWVLLVSAYILISDHQQDPRIKACPDTSPPPDEDVVSHPA